MMAVNEVLIVDTSRRYDEWVSCPPEQDGLRGQGADERDEAIPLLSFEDRHGFWGLREVMETNKGRGRHARR
jgi:hypothetical protein